MQWLLISFLMGGTYARAQEPKMIPPAEAQMNGIRLKDYMGFEKKWTFVTARYRTDNSEQRIVYANDSAASALRAGAEYPDGAAFAKIGAQTQDDPLFPSSKVPTGKRRVQLMLRDKEKYKDTGGWGYALFDDQGQTLPGDQKAQAFACYGCHLAASERRQVFSLFMNLDTTTFHPLTPTDTIRPGINFKALARTDLPAGLAKAIAAKIKTVSFLEGPMRKLLFDGTLEELTPALVKESQTAGRPALILSADEKMYNLILPANMSTIDAYASCANGKVPFLKLLAHSNSLTKDSPLGTPRVLCDY